MEDPTDAPDLVTCMLWSDAGHYEKAVRGFRLLLDTAGPDLAVSYELAETIFVQGHYCESLEGLDHALAQENAANSTMRPALQMLGCLVRAHVTGQLRTAAQTADEILVACSPLGNIRVEDEVSVLVEHNYGCLLVDLCGLRIRSFSDLRDYAINRLKPDFEMLIQQHRFREAWKLASTYGAAQGIHHPCALVELLAAHPDTPMLLKAKAFLWLMEFLDRVKTHRDCETDDSNWNKLYMLARAAWESLDHADGIIPLERSQTYNGNSFQADVLTRCLKHYEHLDNRTQLILTWSRIQGIAGRLGNITKADEAAMEMEEIAKRTGSRLLWMVTRCSVLRNWTIRAAHHGKFISAASALYEELNKTDFFYTRGLAAGHAAVSYINLFDAPLAVMWARRHHTLWLQCPRPDQSKAAFTLLKAEMLNTSQEGGGNSQSIVEMSEKLVQQDIEDNLIENAIAKLDALVTHVSMHQSGATSLREAFDPIFARMRKLIAQLPERTSRLELAKLLQLATITLISEASTRSDIVKEAEAILILDEVCRLYIEATEGPSLVVSSIHQQQGVLCLSMLKKLDRGTTQAITVWEQALEYFGTARGVFAEQGFAREAAISSYWESVLYSDAYLQGYQSAEVALEHLADAERCFALLRTELSAVGGLDAVAIKQRLSSGTYIQDIYRQSFHICSRSGYSLEAWTWTQKSKARSLADLLGLGILVPRAMIDSISSNEDASLLYDEEMALIKEINSAPAAAHFKLKLRLEKLHKHMKNVPVLQDLLDLRAGVPLSWERLQAQLNTQKRLVLVDWVLKGIEIWMIVVRSSVEPAMITLWLNVSTIQTWVDKYLTSPTGLEESIKKDDRDPDNPLRQLDGLVTPLRSFSEPEDILVFCPTSFLHSLPLHALHIDHLTPVIERNPVIYCASLTTFMQCCQRAAESPNNSILEKKIIAVYEPSPDEPFDDVERDEAYASAKRCAAEHNGISLCGRSVTHQAFTSMLEETNMLVYHGHCDLDKRDITNQSLRLSSPDGSPSMFIVKDAFNLRLQAPHISLLACASAHQRFTPGDEPLGLVTALLCAGAASVLGTIWPVQSCTARTFAELFMSKFGEAMESDILNLAHAVREAVLDLRDDMDTRTPYHWAGFVLHGAWFCKAAVQ